MALNRATELEAVNTMLSAVGEPPINSLDAQKNADAAIARNILKEVNREIQTHGWHFNTQRDVSFSPDSTTKEILVGDNVVRIDIDITSVGTSHDERDITQRGNKLFNRTDNTYEFTSDVKATVTFLFDWDDLPEPFKNYVTVRSARIFQDRMVGSTAHHGFSQQDEYRALALLKEFQSDTADHSIFDHYDIYRIVARPDAIRTRTT
ncbi:MAG: putative tail tubular protein [Prokaryotic dsDNA virus sp.]|nr:MAG: putative tail tubular protein [Prokaryotic dsDNA virus sp.]|tara:strand:- start:23941 stop:24561 length:621 start_codon:yes stop_codon:yes gene_type:complete